MRLRFPSQLPITERIDEIKEVISNNQVVIIAGETGSGKSTQLPKICVDLGLGQDGLIGHTQPRRLAARAVAERIAEETETKLGGLVGYKVRFTDEVGKNTRIKLMTDGILLAEMQRDRLLRAYDTLIIDEAHERSLNIDFLLGYLRQLLPKRPDLKVIVTSATIDTARFSEHFSDAPIIEVSGRTFPVELRYRPLTNIHTGESRDQATGICDAVQELWRDQDGDILVFCSGEREIRDASDALGDLGLRDAEIFPLYARLSAAEQHRVFAKHSKRRIVLATNVAETSLTVPGIRTVVDPGTARISRYSLRTKVQRLPIEGVSQASANQRAGRCGRVGPGVCIRLYSEDEFLARDEFTDPEILRTNLASVILQMASLGLGEVADFPFVEPPEGRNIRDGIALLEELDAVDPSHANTKRWLTPMGKSLAKLPVDPRLGRMIIEAGRNHCLHEVMVIVAGMSVQDPRERPQEKRQAADEFHNRFSNPGSDFLSYLELWDYIKKERGLKTQNQFRKLCRREFLNFNRIREWQDIYRQLKRVADELGLGRNAGEAKPDDIHYSLLSGLLSHLGLRDEKTAKNAKTPAVKQRGQKPRASRVEYVGARNARFVVAGGSALSKKPPTWVMAGELVETNRLWARTLAQVDPAWAEQLGEHLVARSYTEPWWEPLRGAAATTERVMLFGLPLVTDRKRNLEYFDAPLAREMFIHHALIEGEWETTHAFVETNERLKAEVEALEARSRQADLMADRALLFRFYDERVPAATTSSRHFNAWWKKRRKRTPDLLNLTREILLDGRDASIELDAFPDVLTIRGIDLDLAYEFDPASPIDGITIDVPLALLPHFEPDDFSWMVPGFQRETAEYLIRSLPKPVRKAFVPVPDTVTELLPLLDRTQTFASALRKELEHRGGVAVEEATLTKRILPSHLRPTFRVVGADNETLAAGKDLLSLRFRLEEQTKKALESVGHEIEQQGLVEWSFGDLPSEVETLTGNHLVRAYPTLVDCGTSVNIGLVASEADQQEAMWLGIRRLLRLSVPAPLRSLDRSLSASTRAALSSNQTQTKAEWFKDATDCVFDYVLSEQGGVTRNEADFARIQKAAQDTIPDLFIQIGKRLNVIIGSIRLIDQALGADPAAVATGSWSSLADFGSTTGRQADLDRVKANVLDALAHRDRLVYPGMLVGVGFARLGDTARHLEALAARLTGLPESATQDRAVMKQCQAVELLYAQAAGAHGPSQELEAIAWMIEDLRASRFAPHLGTSGKIGSEKITEKRIKLAIKRLG